MKKLSNTLLPVLIAMTVTSGCQFEAMVTTSTPSNLKEPLAGQPTEQQISTQGTSSGGGDFLAARGKDFIRLAATDIARNIRNASPEVFEKLPAGFTQEALASLIENIEFEDREEVYRHDELLGFDHRRDDTGAPYLVATKPAILEAASFNSLTSDQETRVKKLFDLQLRLIHEAAHVLGIGTTKQTDPLATLFAILVTEALQQDQMLCEVPVKDADDEWLQKTNLVKHDANGVQQGLYEDEKFYWAIHRPSGRGIFQSPLQLHAKSIWKSIDRIAKGIPLEDNYFAFAINQYKESGSLYLHPLDYLPTLEEREEQYAEFPHYQFSLRPYIYASDWAEIEVGQDGSLTLMTEALGYESGIKGMPGTDSEITWNHEIETIESIKLSIDSDGALESVLSFNVILKDEPTGDFIKEVSGEFPITCYRDFQVFDFNYILSKADLDELKKEIRGIQLRNIYTDY